MYAIKRPATIAPNQQVKDKIASFFKPAWPFFSSIVLCICEARIIPEPMKNIFKRKGKFVAR